mgnify:CR=1 FL=1
MIFVTGGCFQGKQQWVLQNCQVQPFRVADGAVCSMEAIKSAGVLDHFYRKQKSSPKTLTNTAPDWMLYLFL